MFTSPVKLHAAGAGSVEAEKTSSYQASPVQGYRQEHRLDLDDEDDDRIRYKKLGFAQFTRSPSPAGVESSPPRFRPTSAT